MSAIFSEVKKNFGFGCMRLQMQGEQVDYTEFNKMIDYFMDNGFNYFDTAHGYIDGKSELAIKDCLVKRYKRSDYILVNKLSNSFFNSQQEIRPFFESQLEACGVEYFDFYLMHAQCATYFEKYKKCKAYETALELKKEGKIKHFGLSFHDTADVLDNILTEYPQIEVVQLQLNYVDYDDLTVQGRECVKVCLKHQKPIIVMEPVKGGKLVNLPSQAQDIFKNLNGGSNASYAIRYTAGLPNVFMVLSGMSNMEQMIDNLSFMQNYTPLNDDEKQAVDKVCNIIRAQNAIDCTACRYCVAGCPMGIDIPELFSCMNAKKVFNDWYADHYYGIKTVDKGKASTCVKCGNCVTVCPQHLKIPELLEQVAKEFEKNKIS